MNKTDVFKVNKITGKKGIKGIVDRKLALDQWCPTTLFLSPLLSKFKRVFVIRDPFLSNCLSPNLNLHMWRMATGLDTAALHKVLAFSWSVSKQQTLRIVRSLLLYLQLHDIGRDRYQQNK